MIGPTFRALCADLVDVITAHAYPDKDAVGYVAGLLTRARAALAAQPVGPTDEDLRGIFSRFCDSGDNGPPWIESEEFIQSARAVLARWGRPAAAPVPVSALVPALEEDCDAEGRCWWGATALLGSATGNIPHSWRLCRPKDRFGSELVWLPAHALPVPGAEESC